MWAWKNVVVVLVSLCVCFVGLLMADGQTPKPPGPHEQHREHKKPQHQPPTVRTQEIHCKHFFYGQPIGTPPDSDLIIRDLYALSANNSTKFADWVCYALDRELTEERYAVERTWQTDPWLTDAETLEARPGKHDDFRGIGSAKAGYMRSHLVPLNSFKGSPWWPELNFYSNIVPMKPRLIEGTWQRLVRRERELAQKQGHIWVMAGPLYEIEMAALPNCDEPHRVPSGYWKIIVTEKEESIKLAGFIFEQMTGRGAKLKDHLVTIDEIEERSGLDFFWSMPPGRQRHLEAHVFYDWARLWLTTDQ